MSNNDQKTTEPDIIGLPLDPNIIMITEALLQQKAMTEVLTEVLIDAKLITQEEIEKRFEAKMKVVQEEVEKQIQAKAQQFEEKAEKAKQDLMDEVLRNTEPKGEA